MLAHGPGDAASGRPWSSYVTAIGDVRSSPLLIRAQYIRPDDLSVFFRHKYFVPRRVPIHQRVLARHVRRQSVCIAASNHRFENFPNCIGITYCGFPYEHYVLLGPASQIFACAQAILAALSARRETAPSRSPSAQTLRSLFPADTFQSSRARPTATKIAAYPQNRLPIRSAI